MPFITISVDGISQRIAGLDNVINNLENTKQNVLQQTVDFMVGEMRMNAHEVTGRMKSSINGFVTGNDAVIGVGAEYAVYENARPGAKPGYGPHNFIDMAVDATVRRTDQTMMDEYDRLFSSL